MIDPFVTYHAYGEEFSPEEQAALVAVSLGKRHADSLIDRYVVSHGLDTSYLPEDEMDPREDSYGIASAKEQRHAVRYFSSLRAAEFLRRRHEPPFGFDTLQDLHGILFGDILPSAGLLREADAAPFCAGMLVERAGMELVERLQADHYLKENPALLPGYDGDFLALHPFVRENRMAIHLYLHVALRFAGWRVSWERLDPQAMRRAEDLAVMGSGADLVRVLLPAIGKSV